MEQGNPKIMAQRDIHYYAVAAICKHLGLSEWDSYIVSHSSQYVDDASFDCPIRVCGAGVVLPVITAHEAMIEYAKTRNCLDTLSLFHFFSPIAGNLGRTVPLKNDFLSVASPYGLGIWLHILADSFSHRGFVGYESKYNRVKGKFEWKDQLRVWLLEVFGLVTAVGHAYAMDYPDIPGKVYSLNGITINNSLLYRGMLSEMCNAISRFFGVWADDRMHDFMIKVIEHDLLSDRPLKEREAAWIKAFDIPEYSISKFQGFKMEDIERLMYSLSDQEPRVPNVSPEYIEWTNTAAKMKAELLEISNNKYRSVGK